MPVFEENGVRLAGGERDRGIRGLGDQANKHLLQKKAEALEGPRDLKQQLLWGQNVCASVIGRRAQPRAVVVGLNRTQNDGVPS